MLVCQCRAVNARTVDNAIAAGATDVRQVAAKCGAGGRCGGCWPTLERMLEQAAAAKRAQARDDSAA